MATQRPYYLDLVHINMLVQFKTPFLVKQPLSRNPSLYKSELICQGIYCDVQIRHFKRLASQICLDLCIFNFVTVIHIGKTE